MSEIISCEPINKSLSFIIHINNTCNFKCEYCVAGREFSKDFLSYEQILKLLINIREISEKYNEDIINIDITGGEPTLHKDFLYFIEELLKIPNINLQISTNALILGTFGDKLKNINKKNVKFNISFHYFEYLGKEKIFINTIKILKLNNINFEIKFLLPNNYVKLEDFLQIRDLIIDKLSLKVIEYKYYLIYNFNDKISTTYNKKMIAFYNEKLNSSFDSNNLNLSKKFYNSKTIKIKYLNGKSKKYNYNEINYLGLNNFRGFKCYYISEMGFSIYIYPNGNFTLGPCGLLDSKKYSLGDLKNIIVGGKQEILCSEKKCTCGLFFPKNISENYNNIIFKNKILFKVISGVINNKIIDIQIFNSNKLIIIYKEDIYYISLIISNNLLDKSYYTKNDFIYNIKIKDINNIVYNIENIDKDIKNTINKNIILLSRLDKLFKNIL